MAHKIKIQGVADFSSIQKEVKALNDTIENAFGKDGVKVLDESSVLFLKRETQVVFDKMTRQLTGLRKEADTLAEQLKKSTKESGDHEQISKRLVENLRSRVALEKDISNLKRSQNIIDTGTTPEAAAKAAADVERRSTKEQKAARKQAAAEAKDTARKESAAKKREEADRRKADKEAMKGMNADQKKAFKQQREAERLAEQEKREQEKNAKLLDFQAAKKKRDEEKKAQKQEEDEERRRSSFKKFSFNTVSTGLSNVVDELPAASQAAAVGGQALSTARGAASLGMSAPMIAAFTAVAAAAGAAAVAIARMVVGFETFKQGIPNLLAITGMGATPIDRNSRAVGQGAQLGFDVLDMLENQKHMERALGTTQGVGVKKRKIGPEEDGNRLLNILTASRDLGMDPGQIISGGNQLRSQGGLDAANKQLAMILDKAITSGMDKSQASTFLSSAVGLLTDINRAGTANTAEMLGVLSELVSKNSMSAEMASQTLAGINSAISGSSGEQNSFFQAAAADVGLGGGSILGSVMAVRQGLTGVKMNDLQKQVGDTVAGQDGMRAISDMGLDGPDFGKKFAGSILDQVNSRFNQDTKEGRAAALGFTGQMFGAKSAPEAVKILAVLEKMRDSIGLSSDDKKLLEDLGKDPEASWREQTLSKLDATARATAAVEAALKNGQFELGKQSAGLFNALTEGLILVDAAVRDLVRLFSGNAIGEAIKEFNQTLADAIKPIADFLSDPAKFIREAMFGPSSADEEKKRRQSLNDELHGLTGMSVSDRGLRMDPNFKQKKLSPEESDRAKQLFDELNKKPSYLGGGNRFQGAPAPDGLNLSAVNNVLGNSAARAFKGDGTSGKVTTSGVAPGVGDASRGSSAAPQAVDVSEMVSEQKKTNLLLERASRPGGAPRVAPQANRP